MVKKTTLLFLMLIFSAGIYSQFSASGDGSSGNPYKIVSESDLIKLSQNKQHWDDHLPNAKPRDKAAGYKAIRLQ